MDLSGLRNYETNGLLTESLLQKSFIDLLRDRNYLVCHVNNNTSSKLAGIRARELGVVAGFPDLVLFLKGKIILIELKTKSGKISLSQKEFHAKLSALDIPVYIVKGVSGIETFLEALPTGGCLQQACL